MESDVIISLEGRRYSHTSHNRSLSAYAGMAMSSSDDTLPRSHGDCKGFVDTNRSAVAYQSLPDMNRLAAGSRASLGRSLPRLKERIAYRRQAIATSTWLMIKHRISTKLDLTWTFELWGTHIKQVEGHFGTAVASYFVLLRWLFYMNLAIFVVWTLFVSIPQFVVEHPLQEIPPCIYSNSRGYAYVCPRRGSVPVYRTNCTVPNSTNVTVCTNKSIVTSFIRKSVPNDTKYHCSMGSTFMEEWSLCPSFTPPSIAFLDLVTGRGGLSETWLFLGHYSNLTCYNGVSYNRPVAYLLCTALVYVISFIVLIIRFSQAYNMSNVKYNSIIQANFCNRVFSAWDYKITEARYVKLMKAAIRLELQEDLAEHIAQTTQRPSREVIHIILIRIATNACVIFLMLGCGAAIIEATLWSWNELVLQSTNAKGLVVPILVTFFLIALPVVFHIIAQFERHKTGSGQERVTLFRAAIVRTLLLIIYIVAAYAAIQCTQSKDLQALDLAVTFVTRNNRTVIFCRQCWETFIGQQFYNLQVLEFLFVTALTLAYEIGRNLLFKAFNSKVKNKILKSILSRASFSLSDSVLSLLYYQLLMWLGFFFSPVLPLFQVIILFATFYIKKYSLMFNLEPEKGALFRGSRVTFISISVFLIVLVGSLFSVGYAVARFRPSITCGPFQTKASFLTVITEVTAISTATHEFFSYLSSPGFIFPLIMILIVIICILTTVICAKDKLLKLMVTHLDAAGIQLIHIDEESLPAMVALRRTSVSSRAQTDVQ